VFGRALAEGGGLTVAHRLTVRDNLHIVTSFCCWGFFICCVLCQVGGGCVGCGAVASGCGDRPDIV